MSANTVDLDAIKIVGISARTTNENNQTANDIPKLWERFYSENIFNKIPDKAGEEIFAVYTDYESDYTKPYNYIIGCKVNSFGEMNSEFTYKEIPKAKYIQIPVKGEYPSALIQTWQTVWKSGINRAYTSDFELYPDKFNFKGSDAFSIYLAVNQSQRESHLQEKQLTQKKEWEFYLGIGFLACSILADVMFLTVPFLGFSGAKIISLLVIFAAAAELLFLLSILLLGKIVIQKIKDKFQSWFKREKPALPIYISKRRHYVGVILFFLSFIPYMFTEISLLLGYPLKAQHVNFFIFLIVGDVLFITSLFVLGDTFWEKIRALFKWTKPPVNNDKLKTT